MPEGPEGDCVDDDILELTEEVEDIDMDEAVVVVVTPPPPFGS